MYAHNSIFRNIIHQDRLVVYRATKQQRICSVEISNTGRAKLVVACSHEELKKETLELYMNC